MTQSFPQQLQNLSVVWDLFVLSFSLIVIPSRNYQNCLRVIHYSTNHLDSLLLQQHFSHARYCGNIGKFPSTKFFRRGAPQLSSIVECLLRVHLSLLKFVSGIPRNDHDLSSIKLMSKISDQKHAKLLKPSSCLKGYITDRFQPSERVVFSTVIYCKIES